MNRVRIGILVAIVVLTTTARLLAVGGRGSLADQGTTTSKDQWAEGTGHLDTYNRGVLADGVASCRETVKRFSGDDQAVMVMYDDLMTLVSAVDSQITENEAWRLLEAIEFAAEKHKDQVRKNPRQEPYIIHPLGVVKILWEEGSVRDIEVLIAAVLHDTIEDTDTTQDEVDAKFGLRIGSIVSQVTDDKSLPKARRKELQILHAPHKAPQAKLVKLGDKLYNLRDLLRDPPTDWSQQRIDEYFIWAEKVVAGLRGSNDALEAGLDEVFATKRA